MKTFLLAAPAAALLACGAPSPRPAQTANTMNLEPGFQALPLSAWRGYKSDTLPAGWREVDGAITRVAAGGDIVTRDTFANFELRLEWNVSAGGNSGIMYRVADGLDATYMSGPEMQVLDDSAHADGRNRLTSAGSLYGLVAAPAGVVRPPGQWNEVRIIANGAHVEHWLNGQKVVEIELWTDAWRRLLAGTKFGDWPQFGEARAGRIALQDHGDRVAFRNIRIKVLP